MSGRNLLALAIGAAVAIAAVLAAGLFADRGTAESPAVLAATCDVLALAARDQPGPAKVAFLDRAHEPLHELAGEASDQGRRDQAARLLEAKNVVESASTGPTRSDAEGLVDATRAALRAVGEPAPSCPDR